MRARGWRANYPSATAPGPGVPLVSAYRWDTGVQVRAAGDRVEGAVAVTAGTLANPRVDDDNSRPQVSGRVAWKPIVGLVLGASAAQGQFLTSGARGRRRRRSPRGERTGSARWGSMSNTPAATGSCAAR